MTDLASWDIEQRESTPNGPSGVIYHTHDAVVLLYEPSDGQHGEGFRVPQHLVRSTRCRQRRSVWDQLRHGVQARARVQIPDTHHFRFCQCDDVSPARQVILDVDDRRVVLRERVHHLIWNVPE